ncbi:MAG: sugar nucleotide-binding protein, partial [Bacteroidota bacterium]
MKILITGANGLLGQKLVQLLKDKDEVELIATSRGECRIKDLDLRFYYELDVANYDETISLFAQLKPDVVIHTAAMTQVDDCE